MPACSYADRAATCVAGNPVYAKPGFRYGCAEVALPRVAELLEAEGEDAVVHPGRHRHAGVPEGVHARGTVVLDAGDRDAVELERIGERRTGETALQRPHPRGLDPSRLDLGV